MQRPDRWSEDAEEDRPRPSSRRNSASLSRRGSIKNEPEVKKNTSISASSTPKRVVKPQNLDFLVTGKQITKRSERTNSLPGTYHRRPSADSITFKKVVQPKKPVQSSQSRDASLEDDMSLDLSQVSDFEDTNSKYGIQQKFSPMAASTPKRVKPRSCSLQHQVLQKEAKKSQRSLDSSRSRQSTLSCSRESYKSSSHRPGPPDCTELDYSSVSPEYSAPSSADSALDVAPDALVSPRSQEFLDNSYCVSWHEAEREREREGEWCHFWASYNSSVARMLPPLPLSRRYYDQCPTPYRSEEFELGETEFPTDGSRKRSPENIATINNIIHNEGLQLTPRETQNIIKCAHILSSVLTKAIERRAKDNVTDKIQEIDTEKEIKKKTLSLNLKETILPLEVKEEKRWETVTTQTDISLPNTKTAPKIFEKILRQLSKTSLEVPEKEKQDKDKQKTADKEVKEAEEKVSEVGNGT